MSKINYKELNELLVKAIQEIDSLKNEVEEQKQEIDKLNEIIEMNEYKTSVDHGRTF